MTHLILVIVLGFLPSLAHASFSRTQIMQQQMDCVSGYINQGVLLQQDPCYNNVASSKDMMKIDPVVIPSRQVKPSVKKETPQENIQEQAVPTKNVVLSKAENLSKGSDPILKTKVHTFDMGIEGYYYRYREADIGVFLIGGMGGYYGQYSYRPLQGNILNNSIFDVYRLEGRYAQGKLDYKGSGHDDGRPNRMYELRGLLGKDHLLADRSRVTPYFGLGYRYLVDEGGGRLSSDGHFGYDRKSHYFYLPIGVTADFPTDQDTEISLNFEYDYFLQGTQKSYLSDGNQFNPPAFPSFDVSNHQKKGYGLRGSIKFLKHLTPADVYIEPFIRFWNIEDSKVMNSVVTGSPALLVEPHNTTTEVGSKFGVQF